MYFVYIIKSEQYNSYYVGFSEDLRERLKKHNEKGDRYTSGRGPWKLVWYCVFNDEKIAFDFEKYLKGGSGIAFMRKHILKSKVNS